MVKISNYSIKLLTPDGNVVDFEADTLQAKIIKSCIASGVRDIWIAEDISLSIEYALTSEENKKRVFSISDVNTLVIKILEGTGYPEVAETFQKSNSNTDVKISADHDLVSELISRHLGLSDSRLKETTESVIQSMELLHIEEAAPALFIELAKAIRVRNATGTDIKPITVRETKNNPSWLLKRQTIIENLDAATIELINNRIIQIASISRLFPAIKIDFKINLFADFLELDIPLTEMVMITHFSQIADAVNDIIASSIELYKNDGNKEKLPVYINITDMSSFAGKKLLSRWPEAAPCCRDMLSFLEEMINFDIFKIILK